MLHSRHGNTWTNGTSCTRERQTHIMYRSVHLKIYTENTPSLTYLHQQSHKQQSQTEQHVNRTFSNCSTPWTNSVLLLQHNRITWSLLYFFISLRSVALLWLGFTTGTCTRNQVWFTTGTIQCTSSFSFFSTWQFHTGLGSVSTTSDWQLNKNHGTVHDI